MKILLTITTIVSLPKAMVLDSETMDLPSCEAMAPARQVKNGTVQKLAGDRQNGTVKKLDGQNGTVAKKLEHSRSDPFRILVYFFGSVTVL